SQASRGRSRACGGLAPRGGVGSLSSRFPRGIPCRFDAIRSAERTCVIGGVVLLRFASPRLAARLELLLIAAGRASRRRRAPGCAVRGGDGAPPSRAPCAASRAPWGRAACPSPASARTAWRRG